MAVAYAQHGLIGVLTPQANTTVEPEFAILLPQGVASIAARMVSGAPDLEARLVAYAEQLAAWVTQFADAPLDVVAFACTGASYLIGAEREHALVASVAARCGVPVVTSGMAVLAALGVLRARRVAFVSPYPRALTQRSLAYWASAGIAASRVVEVSAAQPGGGHPIYALAAADVHDALASLAAEDCDAVVMLGTGMPTLEAIRRMPRVGRAPIFSCNLATAWRAVLEIDRATPSAASLMAWLEQPEWAGRLRDDCDQTPRTPPATGHNR
jgi:maleate isomerase